jgi:hypothetical protein
MKRILLALLALMTGLVAQAGPVQARVGGAADTEIGMSSVVRGTTYVSAAQTQMVFAPTVQIERRQRHALQVPLSQGLLATPAVLVGPDRALE